MNSKWVIRRSLVGPLRQPTGGSSWRSPAIQAKGSHEYRADRLNYRRSTHEPTFFIIAETTDESMPPEISATEFDPNSLSIITFPHPALRYVAKPIRRVDADLKRIAARMLELMYEHRGVGLAATQVNLPIRMFVMNPSGEKGEGTEQVFLNPVLSRPRSNEEAEEGCLSLPNIHGNVVRAKTIHVNAFDLAGREIKTDLSGFEARVVQHETDHLDGVLFLDRLKEGAVVEEASNIEALSLEYQSRQRLGAIPADEVLISRLAEWEARYC